MEKNKTNLFKSSTKLAVDIAFPSFVPLTDPIEGISREFRYNARLWRIRLGLLIHSVLAIEGVINKNYEFTIGNLGIIAVTIAMIGRPLELRRLKRVCFPFLK